MTIKLTREQERFIKQQLEGGRFASEADVFSEALAALQKQERELRDMRAVFSSAHERNAELDIEATEAFIAEEVRAYRQKR